MGVLTNRSSTYLRYSQPRYLQDPHCLHLTFHGRHPDSGSYRAEPECYMLANPDHPLDIIVKSHWDVEIHPAASEIPKTSWNDDGRVMTRSKASCVRFEVDRLQAGDERTYLISSAIYCRGKKRTYSFEVSVRAVRHARSCSPVRGRPDAWLDGLSLLVIWVTEGLLSRRAE